MKTSLSARPPGSLSSGAMPPGGVQRTTSRPLAERLAPAMTEPSVDTAVVTLSKLLPGR
jgi:hypothetical protein